MIRLQTYGIFSGKVACALFLFCAAMMITAPAQTFKTLADFDSSNGANTAFMALVQGADGNFYGTTESGGANGEGTVFKMTPPGTLTTLYSFCSQPSCTDGSLPLAGLVLATDGNFYGTTMGGGANGLGTVFKITPGGKLTTLYSFCSQTNCPDGSQPSAALVEGIDGNFYGTTSQEGANGEGGTVFKISAGGKLTTLYSFCSQNDCIDGQNPYTAGLIQASDGNFYGATGDGGANGLGTVFKITAGGTLTTLHSFDGDDGANAYAGLVQATNGNFYGTTANAGESGDGTIFEMTPAGVLTTIYNFCAITYCPDGADPTAPLIQATDGNFYGTVPGGGANNSGTVFAVTSSGALTTLYNFCSQGYPLLCGDGAYPDAGLLQATNGDFYGTTAGGGDPTCRRGTVFTVSVGLGPFVKTLPAAGKVGAEVGILGTALSGATGVSFNGAAAQFKVISPTLILTHVPEGATTGKIKVSLPSGTLSSNFAFRVLK
jgi:uncharacterized repeat protein (TIGR03803 family)